MTSKEALEDIILYLNANEPNGLYCENIEVLKQDLERLEELKKENQKAVKIATLLKNKKGYIKSQKGNFMELKISNITHNENKYMVNGYCTYSDNCRYVPLNKVYVSEVLECQKD